MKMENILATEKNESKYDHINYFVRFLIKWMSFLIGVAIILLPSIVLLFGLILFFPDALNFFEIATLAGEGSTALIDMPKIYVELTFFLSSGVLLTLGLGWIYCFLNRQSILHNFFPFKKTTRKREQQKIIVAKLGNLEKEEKEILRTFVLAKCRTLNFDYSLVSYYFLRQLCNFSILHPHKNFTTYKNSILTINNFAKKYLIKNIHLLSGHGYFAYKIVSDNKGNENIVYSWAINLKKEIIELEQKLVKLPPKDSSIINNTQLRIKYLKTIISN